MLRNNLFKFEKYIFQYGVPVKKIVNTLLQKQKNISLWRDETKHFFIDILKKHLWIFKKTQVPQKKLPPISPGTPRDPKKLASPSHRYDWYEARDVVISESQPPWNHWSYPSSESAWVLTYWAECSWSLTCESWRIRSGGLVFYRPDTTLVVMKDPKPPQTDWTDYKTNKTNEWYFIQYHPVLSGCEWDEIYKT